MVLVLVEQTFESPITKEQWDQGLEKVAPCCQAHDIRWIRSMMARDRRCCICEFEAPDAESVRRAFHKAGIPVVRIWTIDVLEPMIAPESGQIVVKGL
jgi:hypothetical protein